MIEKLFEEIDNIEDKLNKINKKYNEELWKRNKLKKEIKEIELEVGELLKENEIFEKRVQVLKNTSKKVREIAKSGMEKVISLILKTCLEENVELKINIDEEKTKPEADVKVVKKFKDKKDVDVEPIFGEGGGVSDLIATFMFLASAYVETEDTNNNAPIFLDEPFKFLSSSYMKNTSEALKSIQKLIGRQIIIVSHKEDMFYNASKRFLITKEESDSIVSENPSYEEIVQELSKDEEDDIL